MFSIERIKIWVMFLVPSMLVGMLVGAYPGYRLYRYTWYDAEFCTSCHVHDYATVGWANSVHGGITTCHDCHHQRFRDYIKEAIIMVKDHPKFPEDLHHTPYVKKELCAACHVSNVAERGTITGPFKFEDIERIPKIDLSHLHSVHMQEQTEFVLQNHQPHTENERNIEELRPTVEINKEKGESRAITCADCHGGPQNRGHNFSSVDSSCVRCHEKSHENQVAKTFGCRSCHFQDFLIPIHDKKPVLQPIEDK